jgi:hypothetical protein
VSGQLHVPVALPQGKGPPSRYPLDRRLGGPRAGLDDMEKLNYWPYWNSNSDPSVVQSVASRYTDYVTTDHTICLKTVLKSSCLFLSITLQDFRILPRLTKLPRSGHVGFVADKTALGQVIPEYFCFPATHSTDCFTLIVIRGWYNMPNSGQCTMWTLATIWPMYHVDSVSPHPPREKPPELH